MHKITVLHIASRRACGVPRIHAGLWRLSRRVNCKRVARIIRQARVQGVTRRGRRSLTRADKKARPAPDQIRRRFHAEIPGTKLAGIITCLPTTEGWLGGGSAVQFLEGGLDLQVRVLGDERPHLGRVGSGRAVRRKEPRQSARSRWPA